MVIRIVKFIQIKSWDYNEYNQEVKDHRPSLFMYPRQKQCFQPIYLRYLSILHPKKCLFYLKVPQ